MLHTSPSVNILCWQRERPNTTHVPLVPTAGTRHRTTATRQPSNHVASMQWLLQHPAPPNPQTCTATDCCCCPHHATPAQPLPYNQQTCCSHYNTQLLQPPHLLHDLLLLSEEGPDDALTLLYATPATLLTSHAAQSTTPSASLLPSHKQRTNPSTAHSCCCSCAEINQRIHNQ
jgi:hypothetical protein